MFVGLLVVLLGMVLLGSVALGELEGEPALAKSVVACPLHHVVAED